MPFFRRAILPVAALVTLLIQATAWAGVASSHDSAGACPPPNLTAGLPPSSIKDLPPVTGNGNDAKKGARLALLLANTTYPRAGDIEFTVANAARDAELVGKALREAGFETRIGINLTGNELRAELAQLRRRSRGADAALIYFAGLGVEMGGANWVNGSDIAGTRGCITESAIRSSSVSVEDLADAVRQARDIGIVLADAGRFYQVPSNTTALTDAQEETRRLEETALQNDVLILYSSTPGGKAQDGPEGGNGPFAEAVAELIPKRGLEVGRFAASVITNVVLRGDATQIPIVYGGLGNRQFYFTPDPRRRTIRGEAAFSDQPCFALIVGNSDYNGDARNDTDRRLSSLMGFASDLRNPVHDARDIAGAMKRIRFDTTLIENADRGALETAIAAFRAKVQAAGSDALVFFYYAGHGVQVDGTNFLVPSQAQLASTYALSSPADKLAFLRRIAVPLSDVLQSFLTPSDYGMNVVVLDACRNDPWNAADPDIFNTKGLADLRVGMRRTIISFAAQPGSTALDGDDRNSPYSGSLKRHLTLPGISVREMFDAVATDVEKKIPGQIPMSNVPGLGETCLGTCPGA
jgi:uncharacterized caspase-like protein